MTIKIGQLLGNYRIVAQIAQGGMATVYRAHQPLLGRDVAIKVIASTYSTDPSFIARFRHEAATVASLRHPHILTVFDFGEEDGVAYLVTELVDGGTLRDLLGEALSAAQTCALLRPVASALDYAHSRGIVHRDVKPSNVLLHRDGTPVLADFGLARVLETVDTRLTMTGQLMGTPSYMAPEQALAKEVGPYTDLYALAAVAYEMLTGSVPFSATTPVGIMLAHVSETLRPAREKNPTLPPAVEGVLSKGLAKHPDDRYATAGAMIAALEHVPYDLRPAAEPPPADVAAERGGDRSNRWWLDNWQRLTAVGAIAGIGALVLAGIVFSGVASRPTPTAPPATAVVAAAPLPSATPRPVVQPTSVPATPVPVVIPPTPMPSPTPVPSPTPSPTWVVLAGGPGAGTAPGKFNQPMGVRLDPEGNVWVVELAGNRIQELAPTGEAIARFGTKGTGPGEFDGLSGLALDGDGNIYVTEWGNSRVQKVSSAGKPLGAWGTRGSGPGQFDFPSGVAVDSVGNMYVADHNNDRIQKLSPTGEPLAQWGTRGTGPGEFNHPASVALDAQGNIYVADVDNHRIQKLSPAGKSLAVWGTKGKDRGQFDRPAEVELDRAGFLYVVDTNNARIQKLSPAGDPVAQWGGSQGPGPGQFSNAQDVAIDADGNLFVADMDNHRIQKLLAPVRR